MTLPQKILSPQEERIEQGQPLELVTGVRPRIVKMLEGFKDKPPQISVDRAYFFTESFKETEALPIVLRWAKALENIMRKIPVYIGDDELIVGRAGPPGRYGILYPELRAGWMLKGLKERAEGSQSTFSINEKDLKHLEEEVIPYWKGKTWHDAYTSLLPEEIKNLIYEKDGYTSKGVFFDLTTTNTSLQWSLDYGKVLQKGFNGIKKEAEERLASFDPFNPENNFDKMPFLKAVIIVCDAVSHYAKRHAELARSMAAKEENVGRRGELLEIAEICDWVPTNPARTFREAIQAQWLTQVASRFERMPGGIIGNGRIDQYLYPFYKGDREAGRISDDEVLELLEHLWLNMAQNVRLWQTSSLGFVQGYSHFEHTTLGGQTRQGDDATNELSYLILQSKKEFPLDFPDLSVRIHSRSPAPFLWKVAELIAEGTGFPKLLNDEAIVPICLAKGAPVEDALGYTGSGCVEVRMLNRDTYMTQFGFFSLGAALEAALNNGVMRLSNDRVGVETGDPKAFSTFIEVMDAFKLQVKHLLRLLLAKQVIADSVRPRMLAAPLLSSLHDLCMKECKDIDQGKFDGATIITNIHCIGFGTVVDSLAAIKKLVYDEKVVRMDELLESLDKNFESKEELRQMCINAPKYGNNDTYVDSIGREIEEFLVSFLSSWRNYFGGTPELDYTPVTAHVGLGAALGATPNGRKAKEALSDARSPSQGADINGPTTTLKSVANTALICNKYIAVKLLNMKLSPQTVRGETGIRNLVNLIKTWCDLKLSHIQFNIINSETLLEAQKNPEKYRNLLVRVAGYSAYFVELDPGLQKEIISRTEQQEAA